MGWAIIILAALSALSFLVMHEAKSERVGFTALIACVVSAVAAFVLLIVRLFS